MEGKRALILFSPKPGDFSATVGPGVVLGDGDRVLFRYPLRGKDLGSSRGEGWAQIRFGGAGKDEGTVLFSTAVGHHAN